MVPTGAIATETKGDVTILRLDRPPVNALDVETMHELADRVEECRENDAVVLSSVGHTFSAGADLRRVLEADASAIEAGIDGLSRLFRTLFVFPRPLVAAVRGHALAGGCVIACGCDHRVMSSADATIGAVELAAGVPFPAWALELVRFAVNNEHFQEVVLFGRAYGPDEALARGLVDEVAAPDEVESVAIARAEELARVPRTTYALTKSLSRRAAVVAAETGTRETDAAIKSAWSSPEVRAAVARRMEGLRRP